MTTPMMIENKVLYVVCGGCGALMQGDRIIATVKYNYPDQLPTVHRKYVCLTPDCGGEVVVETA